MGDFPRYEQYKDSGFEWLGEIPKHWKKWKISHLFTLGRGRVIDKGKLVDNGKYPVYSSQTKENGILGYLNTYDFDGNYLTWTTDGANSGTVFFRKGKFNCTNVCGILKLNQKNICIPQFLAFSLNLYTPFYVRHDINPKLMNDVMSKICVFLPSYEEQKRIVDFLDRKTLEMENAIEKKQCQIELLEEQKTILINQAVTKGLNPDVPMKDSGIEWIGEIPEHWDVKRAKYIFKQIDERSETGQEELLSVSHLTGVTPRSEKNVSMFMAEDYTGSKLCEKDDLVINIMWAWMGALGVSPQMGIVSPSYSVFRQKTNKIFNSWYLEHLLRSTEYIAEYNRRSTGLHSSRLRLYPDIFLDMAISLPPKEEQDQIEKIIKKQTSISDRVIKTVETEIEKIRELKQVLISQAVTGKIKI